LRPYIQKRLIHYNDIRKNLMQFKKYPGRVARISNHVHYGPKTALKQALKNNGVRGFIAKNFNYREILKERLKIDDEDELRELEQKVVATIFRLRWLSFVRQLPPTVKKASFCKQCINLPIQLAERLVPGSFMTTMQLFTFKSCCILTKPPPTRFEKRLAKTVRKQLKRKEFYNRMVATKKYSADQIDEVISQLECLQEWVHYREAALHLELTHMKKPYKLIGNRLLPESGGIQLRLCVKNAHDLHTLGFWCGRDFLEGMTFLPQEDDTSKPTAYFRGIVATYRPYYDKSPQSKCRKITFITVSYDNGKYIDVVANGYYPLSKFKIVSGHGTLESGNYVQCKKITLEN
jgi:hypothetical protein